MEAAGLPAGWQESSGGEFTRDILRDTDRPAEGRASLLVRTADWAGGAVRFRSPVVKLPAGRRYTASFSLRGRSRSMPVRISLTPALGGEERAEISLAPAESWRSYTLAGWTVLDGEGVHLDVEIPGPGELWLDDVRIEEGVRSAPLPAPPPAVKGNRVANSGFELGDEGWSPAEVVAVAAGAAAQGERFARWVPGPNPLPIQCRPFRAVAGQRYTVSFSLRSLRPDARVEVTLNELGGDAVGRTEVACADRWQRASFSCAAPCLGSDRYFVSMVSAADASGGRPYGFDVDAVQVEEGEATPWAPAAEIEVATGLTRLRRFPTPQGSLGIPVQLSAAQDIQPGTRLRARLLDLLDRELVRYEEDVRPGPRRREAPIQLRIPRSGTLRLLVEVVRADRVISTAEAVLTALPPLNRTGAPPSGGFLGGHGTLGRPGEWHGPTIAARAGLRWWRLHDMSAFAHWAVAEPTRGQYRWYDSEIAALRGLGFRILGVISRTPGWAGRDPGGEPSHPSSWPPARLADFGRFCRALAGRYRGKIEAYEIWNEPWSRTFWSGSAVEYAEIAKAAARALRETDPSAQVVGGCFWPPDREFIDTVLSRQLAGAIQAASYHQYSGHADGVGSAPGRDRATLWPRILSGKLSLAGGAGLPLWNTETGIACPPFHSDLGAQEAARQAATELGRLVVLLRAAGVQRAFYYRVWHERGSERLLEGALTDNWSLLDHEGSGKPTLAVLATCARLLDDALPEGRVESGRIRAYVFRRGAQSLLAAWRSGPAAGNPVLRLRIPVARVRRIDLMGNLHTVQSDGDLALLPVGLAPEFYPILGTRPADVLEAVASAESRRADPLAAPPMPGAPE